MNRVLRHAIAQGLSPMIALQMCTLNAASHFGMERDLGAIAPGRRADLILTSSMVDLPIETVIARGRVVAEQGAMLAPRPAFLYPASAKNTVHIARPLTAADFVIEAPSGASSVLARAPTKALELTLPVKGGRVTGDPTQDVCQIALVERHRAIAPEDGGVVNALVSGFGYDVDCAVASTVAHDSHHMIVVGTSRADMALAANRLAEVGGGVVVFREGVERALVPLPVAGLMSDAPAEVVAAQADRMVAAMKACGCGLNNAYMQHSLLALVVIPELRISDQGLVDVRLFEKVGVLV
jgi:adenine deaminase